MKNRLSVITAILLIITSSSAYGFTFTINTTGFPNPSEVESIKVVLSVSNDFSLSSSTPGNAIPATLPLSYPWVTTTPSIAGGLLTLDWYNGDIFDTPPPLIPGVVDGIYTQNNMLNGTISTLTFSVGTILGVNNFLFAASDGSPVSYSNLISSNFQSDNATFNAVPIPAAVWLLGSGVVGLMALRRRMS